MADTFNVFISWSGDRSKAAAEVLRGWLRSVLQAARPWMSETDIDKGSRGLEEVGRALEGMKVGIICLTPENLSEPWILFEAGALSKTLDAKTRVCTYLLGGLRPENMTSPLSMFQWTKAEREDTRRLLHAVNKALDGSPVPEKNLDDLFEGMWPQLQKQLAALPAAKAAAPERSDREMLAEILELTRAGAGNRDALTVVLERVDAILGEVRPSDPALADFTRGWREANARAMGRLSYRGLLSDLAGQVSKTGSEAEGKDVKQKQEQHRMHAPSLKRTGERGKTGDEKK